jgi:hypothetical protein
MSSSNDKKKPTKKRGRPPKKKMKELSQAHGKVEKFTPTTLDQIWGDDGSSRYGTVIEEEYVNSIRDMAMTDLQTHASKIGFIPIDNRENLEKRLIKEFRRHVSEYRAPTETAVENNPIGIDPKIKKILEEGK